MKKLCLFYTNCQGDGILHFLKQSDLAQEYDFQIFHNWQIILGEQDPKDLHVAATHADVFIYQPHEAQHGAKSTEEIKSGLLPAHCKTLSFAYQYNHGFFPIIKHPGGWHTGKAVIERAKHGINLMASYKARVINFDCVGRFAACLAEQARREEHVDLKFVPFILDAYRYTRLFLTENHPTSFFFQYMAMMVYKALRPAAETLPNFSYKTENDVNLPCGVPHHPIATRELGLEYEESSPDLSEYDKWMEELIAKKGEV
jgi:hypothetical protein